MSSLRRQLSSNSLSPPSAVDAFRRLKEAVEAANGDGETAKEIVAILKDKKNRDVM